MSVKEKLLMRSQGACELCASQVEPLEVYNIPPESDGSVEQSVLLCSICLGQIKEEAELNINHWHCLNESMWSEYPPVQVMAWRQLKKLSGETWAQNLLEQIYLDEETLAWAKQSEESEVVMVKDSNGTLLQAGDTVTLIKDLVVKGANFTAKRGTVVRNIRLTDNPEHIEGKVNGTMIVLVARFLKKA